MEKLRKNEYDLIDQFDQYRALTLDALKCEMHPLFLMSDLENGFLITDDQKASNKSIYQSETLVVDQINLINESSTAECSPMNANYFSNFDNIRSDLTSFAFELGLESCFELQLNSNPKASCRNGEKVSFLDYLRIAGSYLVTMNPKSKKSSYYVTVLKFLKDLIGVNRVYFETPENPKFDLINFASKFDLKNPSELNCGPRFWASDIQCCNGERIKFATYLCRYAVSFGMAKSTLEAKSKANVILETMLKKYFGKPEVRPMNNSYFEDLNFAKVDLENFALAQGCESPINLNCSRKNLIALMKCKNGEEIRFVTFLNRAGVSLGLARTQLDANQKLGFILDQLLAKYFSRKTNIPMDQAYFDNLDQLKNDLERHSQAIGRGNRFDLDCGHLTLGTTINCSNGDVIQFASYLQRFAVINGMAKTGREARANYKLVLESILRRTVDKNVSYGGVVFL